MPTDGRTQPVATGASAGHHDSVSRAVGAVGLFGIALIHFIDLFDKFKETPYLGGLYVALIVGCLVAARRRGNGKTFFLQKMRQQQQAAGEVEH